MPQVDERIPCLNRQRFSTTTGENGTGKGLREQETQKFATTRDDEEYNENQI
jgi:hypothetical protein